MDEAGHSGAMSMSLRFEIFPADLDATVDFYVRVLGFTLVRDERADAYPYIALERGDVRIGAAQRTGDIDLARRRPPTGVELVLEVDDLEAEHRRVREAWPLEEDLQERPWGLRDFRVLDPSGYYLRITNRM